MAATDTYNLYDTYMWSHAEGCKIQRLGTSGSYTYTVASDYANRPVNRVDWGDAARFTNWLNNGQPTGYQDLTTTEDGAYYLDGAISTSALLAVSRESDWKWAITSEDEWYKAAYYKGGTSDDYWDYAACSDTLPGRDMTDVSGNNANYKEDGQPYPIDAPYYTTEAGEFQSSNSPYGTFDQGGNIWEWTDTVVDSSPWSGAYSLRGGAYNLDGDAMSASFRSASYGGPTYENFFVGFRVSQALLQSQLMGDANNDNVVDLLDLGILGDNWHLSGMEWEDGDFNDDGVVDLLDLGLLGDNWHEVAAGGMSFSDAMSVVGVPETSTFAMLVAAALGSAVFFVRRRQRLEKVTMKSCLMVLACIAALAPCAANAETGRHMVGRNRLHLQFGPVCADGDAH